MAAEASAGALRAVVGAERELVGSIARCASAWSRQAIACLGSGAQVECPGSDLAGAAVDDRVQVRPAVPSDPELGHVHVPELIGTGDLEKPGRCQPAGMAGRLQELVLAHDPLHPFSIHRHAQLTVASAATIRVPSVGFALATLDYQLVNRDRPAAAAQPAAAASASDRDPSG